MKQKDVLTKNNDLLNVMFHGTPCIKLNKHKSTNRSVVSRKLYFIMYKYKSSCVYCQSMRLECDVL